MLHFIAGLMADLPASGAIA